MSAVAAAAGLDATACNAATFDRAPLDATRRDAAPHDATTCDAATPDGAPRDAAPRDAAPRDATTRDAATPDGAPLDAAPRDATTCDAAIPIGAPRDAATRDAYRRWAPLYPPMAHNPLMRAEQRAMVDRWPAVLTNGRALDLACGTGRYARLLTNSHAGEVIAADFCEPMLAQFAGPNRVCASMMHLPFKAGAFDVVISGLAVGHAAGIRPWMEEIARVLADGGVLLYSDFHPEAARAGLRRSFKDQSNRSCTVPHCIFDVASQREAAAAANLTVEEIHEARVGFELTEPFPQSEEFYRRWHGLPIVLVVRAHK